MKAAHVTASHALILDIQVKGTSQEVPQAIEIDQAARCKTT